MELSVFENGINSHNLTIKQTLEDQGVYVKHENGYSYTVGMKYIECPDLILYGENPDVAEEMFQVILQAIKLGLIKLKIGENIGSVLDPQPTLSGITETDKKDHFYAARTYYGDWCFEVINIVMRPH